jgi:hypothetical protein
VVERSKDKEPEHQQAGRQELDNKQVQEPAMQLVDQAVALVVVDQEAAVDQVEAVLAVALVQLKIK